MKPKTRPSSGTLVLALALLSAWGITGCSTGPARTTARSGAEVVDMPPARSSAWAGVLPSDAVNNRPLAMAEYNSEYARSDASLGVLQGPPGEVLSYYQTTPRPSLEWQYRFTLSTSPDTVTVFRRGDYGGYRRYDAYGSYRRSYNVNSGYRHGY
ncbi:MAG TPA: hypothetical protein VF777_08690 [Phycisphaerales bacterium]